MKNTGLKNSASEMLDGENVEISTKKLAIIIAFINNNTKLLCLYLVQHMLHQIKAQQFYTDLI